MAGREALAVIRAAGQPSQKLARPYLEVLDSGGRRTSDVLGRRVSDTMTERGCDISATSCLLGKSGAVTMPGTQPASPATLVPDMKSVAAIVTEYRKWSHADVILRNLLDGYPDGKRPGMLDVKGRAKWDAWNSKKGQTREQAMEAYVVLVDRLLAR